MGKIIYTLGTDRRDEEDFIEILLHYNIQRVVDVRRFPTSKFPHFRRDALEELLSKHGIDYVSMGTELGGYRKGGYEAYTRTAEFEKGIEGLEGMASKQTTVILCAERFPWRCHRRWIARRLAQRGWKVVHILDKGREWVPH